MNLDQMGGALLRVRVREREREIALPSTLWYREVAQRSRDTAVRKRKAQEGMCMYKKNLSKQSTEKVPKKYLLYITYFIFNLNLIIIIYE